MDALSCSVHPIFPLSSPTLLLSLSFPLYLYLILLSKATKAKKRRGQTLFYSNPKLGQQTQIQPNHVYSRVPLQKVICRLSSGFDAGAGAISTTTQEKGGDADKLLLFFLLLFVFCVL